MSIQQEAIALTRDDLMQLEQLCEWRAKSIERHAGAQPATSHLDAMAYNRQMGDKVRKLREHMKQEGRPALEFIHTTHNAKGVA